MKNNLKYSLLSLLVIFTLLFAVQVVLAQAQTQTTIELQPPSGSGSGLQNPLGPDLEDTDPRVIIGNIIRALLGIVGSLALAVFIYGGFTWVISAGNDDKIKKGKDMIIWATFGLMVIFASYALVSFVIGAVVNQGSAIPAK